MASGYPTSIDDPYPQKNGNNVYDPCFLPGSIGNQGSVSSPFDLSGWTKFALKIDPNGGTLLGTVLSILGATTLQGSYSPVYGTTGAVASTIQCGSTGIQIITGLATLLEPLRFVKFTASGTQSGTPLLTLIVK